MILFMIEPVGGHGGMNYYDLGLISELAKLPEVESVNWYTCDETKESSFDNIYIHKVFNDIYGKKNKYIRFIKYLKGIFSTIRDIKNKNGKITHFHFFEISVLEFINVSIFKIAGFKIIVTLHDVESFRKKNNRFITSATLNKIDKLIVHNNISKTALTEVDSSISKKVDIIRHGNYIPYTKYVDKSLSRKKLNISKDKFTILFFGQIKKVKGLDIFLDALLTLPENYKKKLSIIIAGKVWHDDLNKYNKKLDILKENIEISCFFEYIEDKNVKYFYNSADLVVLPYKKIYQSGVLLMAMSYNVPVLASDLPGMKEIITNNETGFLFEKDSSSSLANRIIDILNLASIDDIKENSFSLVSTKYSWNSIAKKTLSLYKRTI